MRKISLILAFIVSSFFVNSQSYIGFLTDNYSGVHGVISNPANIVDSRFKTDINLVGASAYVGNDYYGINIMDALKPGYDFEAEANKTPLINNSAIVNVDVLGPSFMFNLTPKSSIAVFTRARSFFNVSGFNGQNIDIIDNNPDGFIVLEDDITLLTNSWAELGLTYARILKDNGVHFLKGGVSLKYLQGVASVYARGRNISVDYDRYANAGDPFSLYESETVAQGDVSVGYFSQDILEDDYEFDPALAAGFGADIGFVYEWRPDYKDYVKTNSKGEALVLKDVNKYKLKLGLSITDIGSINYKEGSKELYNVDGTYDEGDYDESLSINQNLNNLFLRQIETGYRIKLPTALHVNADWNFNSKFYLNVNSDLALTKKGNEVASRISSMMSLTPRFETKWFSFYLPFNVANSGFTSGAGFRLGPLYLGSGSIVSALISDNSKSADAYAGLKIPVYQSRNKDKDEDGILDKLDECPEEAGPEENNGCPWGDSDGDTILDNVDACPKEAGPIENGGCPWGDADGDTILDNVDACREIAGPIENNGCPWPDTDGDTVLDKDDDCVTVAGPVELKGCPDTDGDTVLDKDDKCVAVPGTVANNGCPEVTVEVQKSLNQFAKTILFNSGKATIKEESSEVLNEIVKILNEYPSANFSIEGHTDSDGKESSNQILSEGRANAVMVYLIEKGISSNRLTSKGFGESKPIADNKTASGKALNRRVEINLVK